MTARVAAIILGFLVLVGCTATMIVKPGSQTSSLYAPINEAKRPGLIKYLNDGATDVIKSRREDAYKQMYEACGGKYKILGEGPRSEGGVLVPVGNNAFYADSQYMYIQFECEENQLPPDNALQR